MLSSYQWNATNVLAMIWLGKAKIVLFLFFCVCIFVYFVFGFLNICSFLLQLFCRSRRSYNVTVNQWDEILFPRFWICWPSRCHVCRDVFIRELLHYCVIRDLFLILSIIYGIIISPSEIPVSKSRHLWRRQINVEPYLEEADENSYLFFLNDISAVLLPIVL
jgi:hypothetical protein